MGVINSVFKGVNKFGIRDGSLIHKAYRMMTTAKTKETLAKSSGPGVSRFFRVSAPSKARTIENAVTGAGLVTASGAMLATAMMRGMFNQAGKITDQRMGRDMRYSAANAASMTQVGRNTPSMNIGNHTGLALSLHKLRHGR